MRIIVFSMLSLFLLTFSFGQENLDKYKFNPCGTVSEKSDWLVEYQKRSPQDKKSPPSNMMIYVPMTVHIVTRDNGFGGFSEERVLKAMCTLNKDFESSNIQYFMPGNFNYIADTDFFDHESVTDGGLKMLEYNIENTFNCYIVSNPAGNCGYNLPYAGAAMNTSCIGPADHTWSHEMGHGFSLPHPFFGWEGGVMHDNSVSHDFNTPAPDSVFYDYSEFQDTLYLAEERIVSVAQVEKLDGSNCQFAADGFCDTPPDYLASRWACDGNQKSTVEQTDPNGEKFYSDGTLIMSYSFDDCAAVFTNDQNEAMRTNISEKYPAFLDAELGVQMMSDEVVYISPALDQTVQFDNVLLEWEADENAEFYKVEVSRFANFPFTEYSAIVEENSVLLDELIVDTKFYWRVMAYSRNTFCVDFTEESSFETADLVSTDEIGNVNHIEIYPTLLENGQAVNIQFEGTENDQCSIQVLDLKGAVIQSKNTSIFVGENNFKVELNTQSGMYILKLETSKGQFYQKVIVN